GPAESPEKLSSIRVAPTFSSSLFHEKINRFINRLQQSVTRSKRDWGAYYIAIQAFEAMQDTIARQKLAAYPPDIIIEIPRNACETFEGNLAFEMIELLYRGTQGSLLQAELKNWNDE